MLATPTTPPTTVVAGDNIRVRHLMIQPYFTPTALNAALPISYVDAEIKIVRWIRLFDVGLEYHKER